MADSQAGIQPFASRRPWWGSLFVAWVVLTALCGHLYFIVIAPDLGWAHLNEDQMISMRVARMLAETGEPYFNRGDPVAANTSLFWMYPLALVHIFAPDPSAAVWVVYWISTALIVGLAVWTGSYVPGLTARMALVAIIAFSSSAMIYGGSGWEHIPQTILVTLGFLELFRGGSRAHWLRGFWLIAFSFLVRPDSAVVTAVVFFAGVLCLNAEDRVWFVRRSLPAALIPVVYLASMLFFYGDVVPNTYYLKDVEKGVRLADGLIYVLLPTKSGLVPLFCVLSALFWRRLGSGERTAVIGCAAHAIYVVWVGGDAFEAGRFFLIFLPSIALIGVRLAVAFGRRRLALGVALVLAAMAIGNSRRIDITVHERNVISQLRLADKISKGLQPADGAVGLHFLGVGYRLNQFQIVDFYGKADPWIARMPAKTGQIGHNKWDHDHSIDDFDIAAVFISHSVVVAEQLSVESRSVDGPEYGLVTKIRGTGRFSYLTPKELCVDGNFGLFVKNDLADELQHHSCRH